MSTLLLSSLEVKNFGPFRHLAIKRLGRVNLIVGKNNVGKTSLLEALWLLAQGDKSSNGLLQVRDQHMWEDMKHSRAEKDAGITIGPIGAQEPHKYSRTELIDLDDAPLADHSSVSPLITNMLVINGDKSNAAQARATFIPSTGLATDRIGDFWDAIALTVMEEEIVAALRIIELPIERVALVYTNGSTEQHTRIPKVRVAGQDNPIPLRSLGEGMVRLFGLALALVNTRDGLFLIDEIESGLHYSVQPDVWRLVFRLAQRLNIQVFATTHSWDCVEAFQFVAGSHPEEGQLIRLGRHDDDVIATLFDEQELAIITRDHIEVR